MCPQVAFGLAHNESVALLAQVLAKTASEVDPDADGLTFQDFQSILQHAPDFVSNFRISP